MDNELKGSVIVFVDILGFKRLLENEEDAIIKIKKYISEKITKEDFNQLAEDLKVLEKWTCFKKHVGKHLQ